MDRSQLPLARGNVPGARRGSARPARSSQKKEPTSSSIADAASSCDLPVRATFCGARRSTALKPREPIRISICFGPGGRDPQSRWSGPPQGYLRRLGHDSDRPHPRRSNGERQVLVRADRHIIGGSRGKPTCPNTLSGPTGYGGPARRHHPGSVARTEHVPRPAAIGEFRGPAMRRGSQTKATTFINPWPVASSNPSTSPNDGARRMQARGRSSYRTKK